MTTTNATQTTNQPTFTLFSSKNQQRSRVGVAFENQDGEPLTILIGNRGDPDQRRFALYATDAKKTAEPNSPIPVGELFDITDGQPDYDAPDGFAYLCSDGSYNLVLKLETEAWTADDLFTTEVRQMRVNMRRLQA
jgi:hypothetical protein